jgi:hypothetical protein
MHPVDTIVRQAAEPTTESVSARLPLTVGDVERWFANAESGSTLAYHHGFLALDRGPGSRLGEDAGEELHRVARAMMAMAEEGYVHLVQRRHGPCHYSYLAVKSRSTGARRIV